MVKEHRPTLLAEDFVFLEAPRWHQDCLWVSDVFDKKLFTIQPDGTRSVLRHFNERPCGLGFLPDGTSLVISTKDRKILKLVDDGLAVHADLSTLANGNLNDMAVDDEGRVYVGNFGYDFYGGALKALTDLHRIELDGSISVAASGLDFPNGIVIVDGGRTLVVAETWSCKLTAFDRAPNGELSNRRVYADLAHREPDGLCADAAGGIWVGCFNTGEFLRVIDGGEITDRAVCGQHAVACALGGAEGRTLYCCAYTGTLEQHLAGEPMAAIFTAEVEVPGVAFAGR